MAKKASSGGWESERVIALIGGGSGDGKSFFVANLRNALIYDTDIGGGLAYADERIAKNASERIETSSYVDILADLKARSKDGRLQKVMTVAIDHITALQQESNLRHNPDSKSDYGRANEQATREWRKIREFARHMDFNLIVTAHLKGKYENDKQIGFITDGSKNLEADMGIVVYLRRMAKYPSLAQVVKWRRDPEDSRGPVPDTFPFTLAEFEKIAGSAMSRERREMKLASAEQVSELKRLIDVIKLPEGETDKWLNKAGVDTFEEMPCEAIAKCIAFLEAKIKPAAVA